MYLLHESAEARLLPWSEVLHAATEPYGPDGIYGQYISVLLFLVPVAVAAAAFARARRASDRRRGTLSTATPMPTILARVGFGIAVVMVAGIQLMSVATREPPDNSVPAPAHELAAIAGAPHLLFRHTAADPNYGRLGVAPLDAGDSPAPGRGGAWLREGRIRRRPWHLPGRGSWPLHHLSDPVFRQRPEHNRHRKASGESKPHARLP